MKMTDRYTVIHPDTLEAMRRAGHVAKLEARIEKLEAALREIETLELDPRNSGQTWVEALRRIARKALEGKDE
jgi:tRNA A58 N-methylase Trm61